MPRLLALLFVFVCAVRYAAAGEKTPVPDDVQGVFSDHCFGCHGGGSEEGGLDLERLIAGGYSEEATDKWVAVWKNLRAETMPPADEDAIAETVRSGVVEWIQSDVFRLDADNPDPGFVTARRLNREEYRHSIRELLGVDYDVNEEFPADDTGYGFDTIGDVLNMSPVLFEKYLAAADEIMSKAIPLEGPSEPEFEFWGDHWKGSGNPRQLPFDKSNVVTVTKSVSEAGQYRIHVDYSIENDWTQLSETLLLTLRLVNEDGTKTELAKQEAGWSTRRESHLEAELDLPKGSLTLELEVQPGQPHSKPADPDVDENTKYKFYLAKTTVVGPIGGRKSYRWPATMTFFDGPPPDEREAAHAYAREVIRLKANLAYRRPIDEATLDRLTAVAVTEIERPGQRFEHGIKAALSLVFASPRFLFRTEGQPHPDDPSEVVLLDEFDLASRMAYFLWSAPPNEHLHNLAAGGKLRAELDTAIDKMLEDGWRRERFVKNFVGQWLQTRDLQQVESNESAILGRDHPRRRDFERSRYRIRDAMQKETEALFDHLLMNELPVEELLTARYTFLNRYSAEFYGVDGPKSGKLERVELDNASHRRGILTHGSVLLVTSNPTRTSPVKRGLFVLENILGTPSPPPPPNVPELTEVTSIDIRTAPLRKVLEAHRESPECASCHQRMDPLGLALEHYDALGAYRDVERARKGYRDYPSTPEKPIDVTGELMTGESFQSLDELIDILASTRKRDLYRCLAEKLLTYSIGRGIEYWDAPAIDKIVDAVEADNGSMKTLLNEVIRSRPFQYRRGSGKRVVSNQ